jgi:hypothetical protein
LVCAGCFDFAEPDFPEAGAPAVIQVNVLVDEAGHVGLEGSLAPGLQIGGSERTVRPDTLRVNGLAIAPTQVKNNGTRVYAFSGILPHPQELTLAAPQVEEVSAQPPSVDWFAITKTDPDTIVWRRGTDLLLHLRTGLGTSTPRPSATQWFLDLTGSQQFRISSDGLPPDTLRIPPAFVPAGNASSFVVNLSFYQTGKQQASPGDYIGLVSYTFQIRWIVRVTEP